MAPAPASPARVGRKPEDAIRLPDLSDERWDHAADLNLVLASIGDHAVITLDREGHVVAWNGSAQAVLGYADTEILRRHCRCFYGQEEQARDAPRDALRVAREAGRHVAEGWRLRHDGLRFWACTTTRPLMGPAGQVRGYLMVIRDLSSNHAATATLAETVKELRATNRLLLRAEAAMHVGHWRLEVRTGALEWSAEMFRICGWATARNPDWRGCVDAFHPDDRARVDHLLREAIRTGQADAIEARVQRPRGDVRHVMLRAEPDPACAGNVAVLLGTMQDVTELHGLETSLREAHKLEAVGRVAARIAHDLTTVLAGVEGEADIAADPAIDPLERIAAAQAAATAVRRAGAVTQGLLTYARRQVLRPQPVPLAALLEETARGLVPLLPHGVTLEFSCDPVGLQVQADPHHLRAALHNLAVNGCEAMSRGGLLSMRARLRPAEAVITVSDTGAGMDAAALGQAFDPFFTTKEIAGAGLGLTVAQDFARQSGGDLQIASVVGRGTQVDLLLPMAAGTPLAAAAPRPAREGGRLLLVDDVADVLVISAAFLRGAGFDVAFASSGDEALARISAGERFDALVSDYSLPGLNGIELILQARQVRPGLPALLISGFTDIARVETLPPGVALMSKPFQRREFVAALQKAIELAPIELGEPERRQGVLS
jgi:PAS domain S-box-containing protein